MAIELKVLKRYSFEAYAPAILGADFSAMQLTAILDWRLASQISDVQSVHTQVFGQLPLGTPRDYTRLVYYRFQSANGADITLAREWIRMDTLQEHEAFRAEIVINNVSPTENDKLRLALIQNGFISFSINYTPV